MRKIEQKEKAIESKAQAQNAYEEVKTKLEKEDDKYGYDSQNFARFSKTETKQIADELKNGKEAQQMTDDLVDSMLRM